jgi:hypothetical protein
VDVSTIWLWLGANASALAAVAALTSIVMFIVRAVTQLYSSISLNETVGRLTAFVLRVVGYAGDRIIWIFVGAVLVVSTNAFDSLSG